MQGTDEDYLPSLKTTKSQGLGLSYSRPELGLRASERYPRLSGSTAHSTVHRRRRRCGSASSPHSAYHHIVPTARCLPHSHPWACQKVG